jgi:hypothetical protein
LLIIYAGMHISVYTGVNEITHAALTLCKMGESSK